MFYNFATLINAHLTEVLIIVGICLATLWSLMSYTQDWRKQRLRLLKVEEYLSGPPTLPIIGNSMLFWGKPDEVFYRLQSTIKSYTKSTLARLWIGPVLVVIVTSPRDIQAVLNSPHSERGMVWKLLYPFVGEGLLSIGGKNAKPHRNLFMRALNSLSNKNNVEVFHKHSEILMKKLTLFEDGRVFDFRLMINGYFVDVACEIVMGYTDINDQNNPDHDFNESVDAAYKIIPSRVTKPWLYPDWLFKLSSAYRTQCKAVKIIHSFTEKCIATKRRSLSDSKFRSDESIKSSNEETYPSMLEHILELNNVTHELTDEELRDEIFSVYIAAQDALAVTSSFVGLMLAVHQDVQEKARQEVQEILINGETITAESLSRMKYVEMIVKETLRLFPLAPFLTRELKEDLRLDSCTLPTGCQVVIGSYITHRSNKYWEDPERFEPERFSIEESSKRCSYTYMPFSAGPKACLAPKFAMVCLKTLFADLLRRYKITTKVRMEDIKLQSEISIRAVNGYEVSLEPVSGCS